MPVIFWDTESRSTVSLTDAGAWRYAAHQTTEILTICFAVDNGAIETWTPGEPIPKPFTAAARSKKWLIVSHGQFEIAMLALLLHPRYGWPLIPLSRWRDTMAASLASALPASLEGAAEALGLPFQKDREGHRLMMQMAKPRRPRKGEDRDQICWHDDPERRARLAEYCKRDVELGRELYRRVPALSADEQALWVFDGRVNRRGFFVDLRLAEAARKIVQAEQEAIDQEVAEITGGKIVTITQVAKLTALLRERGHKVAGLTKKSVSAVLAHNPSDEVRRLLELRQEGGLAAARKLGSLIAGIDADQRLRGCFQFHAASTGRWAGRRFQPQNLRKPQTKDLDAAIEAILSGDLARVRALGAPLALVGDLSRSLICAAPEHTLIGADFGAIESRTLAWLAGETWKLDTYKNFDATGDLKFEVYCATASRILQCPVTSEDEVGRGIGKICDLAFGYGGGLGAWRRFDSSNTYTDEQVEDFKTKWRTQHAATVAFWHALEGMLRRALRTKQHVTWKNAADYGDGNLYLILPSGRRLTYPEAHFVPGKFANGKLDIA
jgi:DNA polymerase